MILALHGNVGSIADFDFLSDIEDIKPVDLWKYSHLSLADAADAIEDLAKDSRPRGIMGYSMGGRIALQSLATEPNYWDYAIIISAHPGLPDSTQRKQRLESDQDWADLIRNESWHYFLEKWNAQSVLSGPSPADQADLEDQKQAIAKGFENWSLGRQDDLRPKLSNHPCPIFWIVGENDEKFLQLGKEAVAEMPNGLLVKAPNCGHRVLLEAQAQIKSLLEALE